MTSSNDNGQAICLHNSPKYIHTPKEAFSVRTFSLDCAFLNLTYWDIYTFRITYSLLQLTLGDRDNNIVPNQAQRPKIWWTMMNF